MSGAAAVSRAADRLDGQRVPVEAEGRGIRARDPQAGITAAQFLAGPLGHPGAPPIR